MDGQIGFLPWMQKGLIKYSSETEGMAGAPNERARVKVRLTTNGGVNIDKPFNLLGPGDVLNVDPSMIIRTEPANGVFNFSDNLMAFIEFADVDFPWQFTPNKTNNINHLTSWLSLVVLKDDEYTINEPAAEGLPKILTMKVGGNYDQYFHPQGEHWAWAHVQISKPLPAGISLSEFLQQDPAAGISRLLCPRRLAPNTQYTAFLIPAYETGRLAGIGTADLSSVPSQKMAWDISATIGVGGVNQFPVYYSWRFGTALMGDFETLARAIERRAIDPALGGIKMDISNSGMGLNSLFPGVGTTTVEMEGALMPEEFIPAPPQSVSSVSGSGFGSYTSGLLNIVNLSADLADDNPAVAGPLATNPPTNPYIPGLNYANDDPVVLPPMYGQWHAKIRKITSSTLSWMQHLNLDVRYRAAAGLGSKVVRENQEHFMEAAWNQVGEVQRINDLMSRGRFAVAVSNQIYQKHFVGNAKSTLSSAAGTGFGYGCSSNELMSRTINIGSKFLGKILNNPTTSIATPPPPGTFVTAFAPASYNGFTLKNVLTRSLSTKASVDSGFGKVVRNRSYAVQRLSLAASNRELVANVSQVYSPVKAATVKMTDPSRQMLKTNLTAMATANAPTGLFPGAGMVVFTSSVYIRSFDLFRSMLDGYDLDEATVVKPTDLAINTNTLATTVINAVNPTVTITNRVLKQIELQYGGATDGFTGIDDKIMAYPVMDEPAYKYLAKISTEYLLPNLSQYPNNTVALLKNNNKFIEAFMVGLNHEFSKELMWRGYPTDQRGSYFRRFWDVNDTYKPGSSTPNYLYDINRIHKWGNALGDNNTETRLNSLPSGFLVLLVRADLLKKYPNTLIYAQKAVWANTIAPPPGSPPYPVNSHALDENVINTYGTPDPLKIQFPIFKAQLDPDVVLLGFNLTESEVKGNELQSTYPYDPGWFFVFRERPGQVTFGMDAPPPASAGTTGTAPFWGTWDNMNWDFMKQTTGVTSVPYATARLDLSGSSPANPIIGFSGTGGLKWNNNATPGSASDAAQVASILFQSPVLIGIHGRSLLL